MNDWKTVNFYVCSGMSHDGYTEPLEVFTSRAEAEDWVASVELDHYLSPVISMISKPLPLACDSAGPELNRLNKTEVK